MAWHGGDREAARDGVTSSIYLTHTAHRQARRTPKSRQPVQGAINVGSHL